MVAQPEGRHARTELHLAIKTRYPFLATRGESSGILVLPDTSLVTRLHTYLSWPNLEALQTFIVR